MKPEILRNGPVNSKEICALRTAVGWDAADGTYDDILKKLYAYYTVRNDGSELIGYVSVLSDGIADAFLIDLMVHPEHQESGLGIRIVRKAASDVKQAGIQCIQVTFDDSLEPFYRKCGFHIFRGGIIDFKNMAWD